MFFGQVGWLGYSNETVTQLCHKYLSEGFTVFKLKVGQDLADDKRRCRLVRQIIGDDKTLVSKSLHLSCMHGIPRGSYMLLECTSLLGVTLNYAGDIETCRRREEWHCAIACVGGGSPTLRHHERRLPRVQIPAEARSFNYISVVATIHYKVTDPFDMLNVQMVDANQNWDVQEAIDWMKELAEFKPLWIEEPTSPDDVLGHLAISKVRTTIET